MRFSKKALACLHDESECEHCDMPIKVHEWVELDRNGVATNCSLLDRTKPREEVK